MLEDGEAPPNTHGSALGALFEEELEPPSSVPPDTVHDTDFAPPTERFAPNVVPSAVSSGDESESNDD
jgi:hypothetical protein